MKTLPLVVVPQKTLREPSKEIPNVTDPQFKALVPQMIETMFKEDGVGLAAPQIGINVRLIVVSTKDGPLVCFNPVVIKRSWSTSLLQEGCLSVPGYYGKVRRHRRVEVAFTNEEGKQLKLAAHGLLAQIFQHEVDHIDGVLYVDRAKVVKEVTEEL